MATKEIRVLPGTTRSAFAEKKRWKIQKFLRTLVWIIAVPLVPVALAATFAITFGFVYLLPQWVVIIGAAIPLSIPFLIVIGIGEGYGGPRLYTFLICLPIAGVYAFAWWWLSK